jgi:prepilin-type N-terminal cleavage/methylation domain-containing protein
MLICKQNYWKSSHRRAFSLVELMVVVVIIVILAGLVAGVVVKAIDASRTTTSLTTMEVIQSGLTRQLQQVIDGAKKGGKSPEDIAVEVQKIFPTSIAFAKTGYKPYAIALANIPSNLTKKDDLQAASSVLLRAILEKGPFSKIETDQLPKGAIGPVEINSTQFEGIRDSWGDPIGLTVEYLKVDPKKELSPTNSKVNFTLESRNTARGGK